MRFYIKTIVNYIFNLYNYPKYLYPRTKDKSFPENPISEIRINARLRGIKSDLHKRDFRHNIGALYPKANSYAAEIYKSFVKYNSNHLGNWSVTPPKNGTQQLEYEVVHKMINLYNATDQKLEGYLTSGGTEGNTYAIWLAKNYLLSKLKLNEIVLLKTGLTHYSIEKSAELCSIDSGDVGVSPSLWEIDQQNLRNTILEKVGDGKKGFIIALTHGYTETGTNDNLEATIKTLEKLKKENESIFFLVFIDASLAGLVLPFVNPGYKPFKSPMVYAYITDFHKFLATPYPSGLVIYRSGLRKFIEKNIRYVDKLDNTIAGSRPGAPAPAVWASIHKYGKRDLAKIIKIQIKLKNYFIERITKILPDTEIISDQLSLSCGIIFKSLKQKHLPKNIEDKYWMHANKGKILMANGKLRSVILYKIFFLPQITKGSIDDFLKDIKKYKLSGT